MSEYKSPEYEEKEYFVLVHPRTKKALIIAWDMEVFTKLLEENGYIENGVDYVFIPNAVLPYTWMYKLGEVTGVIEDEGWNILKDTLDNEL